MPMVGRVGVEPTTSRLSGVRSNHLSYRPVPAAPSVAAKLRLMARFAALAGPVCVQNSLRYFVSQTAFLMKGHEDGGICSLEWRKLFSQDEPRSAFRRYP